MRTPNQPQPKRSRSAADDLTFNVSGLLAEPAGSLRDVPVDAPPLDLGPDLRQNQGVAGTLRLTRTNRGLLVQARLATSIEQEALPSIDFVTGLPLDASLEPDVLRLNDHHELELEGEVREAILLAEPIAPLCRPDCPGLCPICGEELANGPHDHPDAEVDPRLEALRDFHPSKDE